MAQIEEEGGIFDSKVLFKKAMAGEWSALVDMYRKYPLARIAKFTRAKNTVLHLAVLNENDDVVVQLLSSIQGEEEARDLLSLQDNLGNTPLHVAAALGLPRICWLLAQKCKELVVTARNSAGETSLYIAARHGKKMTFFVLQDFVPETLMESTSERTLPFYQRQDGNTILHAAVHSEYFGLAIEIITLYPRLVNFYNEIGQTPLHLLANMPLAFKSGSRLGGIDKIIYSCIIVDELKLEYKRGQWKKEKEINKPEDYARVMNLFQQLAHICRPIVSYHGRQRLLDNNNDGRNAPTSNEDLERGERFGNHGRSTKQKILENLLTFIFKMVIVALTPPGSGIPVIDAIKRQKIKHEHASQLMEALVQSAFYWEYGEDGKLSNEEQKQDEIAITTTKLPDEESSTSESSIEIIMQTKNLKKDGDKKADEPIQDGPILIAAKQGIVEMVKSILDKFPNAVQDFDSNHKNIVLLSAEHRQMQVYKHLLERKTIQESLFGMVDKDGNSALHLVARLATTNNPWLITKNIILQVQGEYKLYKFVENSMKSGFFQQYNNKRETAMEIFSKSHESLVKEGEKWLTNTSQSCSVVAVLVAGVAYASATTVPGGLDQTMGFPIFAKKSIFKWFAWSSFVALHSSIFSVLAFLSILTSSFEVNEFERKLPKKLCWGLITLFVSISMMLLSFSDGFFVMEFKHNTYAPIYYGVFLYLAFGFLFAEFPFFIDLWNSNVDVPLLNKSLTF